MKWGAAAAVVVCVQASDARAESLTKVEIAIAASDAESAALEPVLRDLLSTTGLPVVLTRVPSIDPRAVVEPPASFAPGVARVFVDISGNVARVYLVDAAWARVLLRRIPLPKGLDEIAREQVGHVIAGSIEALAAGASIGIARDDARSELGIALPPPPAPPKPLPPPPAIPIPAPKPGPSPTASLGVGYEGAAWSNAVAIHALVAHLAVRLPSDVTFSVGGLARLPVTVEHRAVGARVDGWGLRAGIGFSPRIGARLRLWSFVGGGFDRLRIEPQAEGAALGGPVRSEWNPIVRASLGLDARISSSVSGRIAFFADVDLGARSFVVLTESGAAESVVEPFRIRPGITISLHADLL